MSMQVVDFFIGEVRELSPEELVFSQVRDKKYVLSVPHAGTCVPEAWKSKYRLGELALKDTDMFTRELYDTGEGIQVFTHLNRYVVNVNRERLTDEMVEKYAEEDALHGFLKGMEPAWKEKFTAGEEEFLLHFYDRYHLLLEEAVETVLEEQGSCVLLDCHSMNAHADDNTPDSGERPDFDVCTNGGTSVSEEVADAFQKVLEGNGFDVKRNEPYTGGFITRQHSNPEEGVHGIQLEINKSTYMDEESLEKKPEQLKEVNELIKAALNAAVEETKRIN